MAAKLTRRGIPHFHGYTKNNLVLSYYRYNEEALIESWRTGGVAANAYIQGEYALLFELNPEAPDLPPILTLLPAPAPAAPPEDVEPVNAAQFPRPNPPLS